MGGIMKPAFTMASVFSAFGREYIKNNYTSPEQKSVICNIINCRTSVMGSHWSKCPDCVEILSNTSIPAGTGIVLHARMWKKKNGSWKGHTTCCLSNTFMLYSHCPLNCVRSVTRTKDWFTTCCLLVPGRRWMPSPKTPGRGYWPGWGWSLYCTPGHSDSFIILICIASFLPVVWMKLVIGSIPKARVIFCFM